MKSNLSNTNKKSLILFEMVLSIVLVSIILYATSNILVSLQYKNKTNYTTNLTKIEFESTKLFLENILKYEQNFDNISYLDDILFYQTHILEKDVTKFGITKDSNFYKVNICINLYNNICQQWIIR